MRGAAILSGVGTPSCTAGLALHYDGIYNAGVGVTRTMIATNWINHGSRPGMNLYRTVATGGSKSSWGAKGYVFDGKAQFNSAWGLAWPTTFSAQALVDAKYADNTHASGNYIAATSWNMFGMQIDGIRNVGRVNARTAGGVSPERSTLSATMTAC